MNSFGYESFTNTASIHTDTNERYCYFSVKVCPYKDVFCVIEDVLKVITWAKKCFENSCYPNKNTVIQIKSRRWTLHETYIHTQILIQNNIHFVLQSTIFRYRLRSIHYLHKHVFQLAHNYWLLIRIDLCLFIYLASSTNRIFQSDFLPQFPRTGWWWWTETGCPCTVPLKQYKQLPWRGESPEYLTNILNMYFYILNIYYRAYNIYWFWEMAYWTLNFHHIIEQSLNCRAAVFVTNVTNESWKQIR